MGRTIASGAPQALSKEWTPVRVTNPEGVGPCIILCDHASNYIPDGFGTLGLHDGDLQKHIAWDPGALGVSAVMSRLLDAPLVESCVSRLIIDCNRPLDAPDLVPSLSEATIIPANENLNDKARRERIELSHKPYHAAIERLVQERKAAGLPEPVFIAVHSYTPVYRGVKRPWHIGIIHDADERLSAPLIAGLKRDESLSVGDNEPYSPADRVYYTLERHARAADHSCVMVEIRNDLITNAHEEKHWGEKLALILQETLGKN
ncbi:N-formylglutamate amidohydrolase [Phyllobacterium sp. SB3]|uniref:N-formylglutamate amidohydrolase n=1 Tax=Phyllobacterium sp. SB3 TaxID=3156073 RepID=UPI0032AF4621